jgi:putative ubiquitin-RnfH superfamily antitoxin RatB of RatAB toxin-antitoxin module
VTPEPPAGARFRVAVAYSPAPGEAIEVEVWVEPGATVEDALQASGVGGPDASRAPGGPSGGEDGEGAESWESRESTARPQAEASGPESARALGIWGRPCTPQTTLRPGDRVELYRPLAMDPKEARRLRASRRPKRER